MRVYVRMRLWERRRELMLLNLVPSVSGTNATLLYGGEQEGNGASIPSESALSTRIGK